MKTTGSKSKSMVQEMHEARERTRLLRLAFSDEAQLGDFIRLVDCIMAMRLADVSLPSFSLQTSLRKERTTVSPLLSPSFFFLDNVIIKISDFFLCSFSLLFFPVVIKREEGRVTMEPRERERESEFTLRGQFSYVYVETSLCIQVARLSLSTSIYVYSKAVKTEGCAAS